MDILFGGQKSLTVDFEGSTVLDLILYLKNNKLTEREELFVIDNHLRSGILVLINDCDWEVFEQENTQLKDGDSILFLSTLHGG